MKWIKKIGRLLKKHLYDEVVISNKVMNWIIVCTMVFLLVMAIDNCRGQDLADSIPLTMEYEGVCLELIECEIDTTKGVAYRECVYEGYRGMFKYTIYRRFKVEGIKAGKA